MFRTTPAEKAYFTPFIVFMGLLVLGQVVAGVFDGQAFWAFSSPQYWVQPAQTLICGALVLRNWCHYEIRTPAGIGLAIFIGVLAWMLWISPLAYVVECIFPAVARAKGFDPSFFGEGGWPYTINLLFRFLRLVVVVPIVEEVFWRGFLLRWLIREDFLSVPFGAFAWKSFAVVTLLFMLEHPPADYPAALITGALFNVVAIRNRSLASCVLTHAITNFLLGLYILWTGELGFW